MGALSESEIFDCLTTNLRLAAVHCEDLAILPAKGPTYVKLRDELRLIEGAARQASVWREDTRWLTIGTQVAEAHKRAGNWLRAKQPAKLFLLLRDYLVKCFIYAEQLRTKATGRRGMILPDVLPGPHRDTRPSRVILPPGMTTTPGGIILPSHG